MTEEICKDLQDIHDRLLGSSFEGEQEKMYQIVSKLHNQIRLQRVMSVTTRLLKDGGTLPVRRITYNTKKHNNARLERLRTLGLEDLIFCLITLPSLQHLASEDFEWLLSNVNNYLAAQNLPLNWIKRPQIENMVLKVPEETFTAQLANGDSFISI